MNATTTETIITTREQIRKAMVEGFKRYNENPSEFSTTDYQEPDAIGSADYLIQLLHEVN